MRKKLNSELLSAWLEFNEAFTKISKILGSRIVVGEFAETLACRYYGAEKAQASKKGYDLILRKDEKEIQIQVKARRITDLKSTQLSPIRNWKLFDILVVILFSESGEVLRAWEIDSKSARKYAAKNDYLNCDIIRVTDTFLKETNARDITEELKKLM